MLAWGSCCVLCMFSWSSSAYQLPEGGRRRAYFFPQVPFLMASSLFFLRDSTACSSMIW